MITEVRVHTTQEIYEYSTDEGDLENDLEEIVDINLENGYIKLKLKDGSVDEYINVQFCITTKP